MANMDQQQRVGEGAYSLRVLPAVNNVGRFTRDQWQELEKELMDSVVNQITDGDATGQDTANNGLFYDKYGASGIVACSSERSSSWWQRSVQRVSSGRAVAVQRATDKVEIQLSARHQWLSDLKIARSLAVLNLGPMSKWGVQVLNEREVDEGRQAMRVRVRMPRDDARRLMAKRNRMGQVPWADGFVTCRIVDDNGRGGGDRTGGGGGGGGGGGFHPGSPPPPPPTPDDDDNGGGDDQQPGAARPKGAASTDTRLLSNAEIKTEPRDSASDEQTTAAGSSTAKEAPASTVKQESPMEQDPIPGPSGASQEQKRATENRSRSEGDSLPSAEDRAKRRRWLLSQELRKSLLRRRQAPGDIRKLPQAPAAAISHVDREKLSRLLRAATAARRGHRQRFMELQRRKVQKWEDLTRQQRDVLQDALQSAKEGGGAGGRLQQTEQPPPQQQQQQTPQASQEQQQTPRRLVLRLGEQQQQRGSDQQPPAQGDSDTAQQRPRLPKLIFRRLPPPSSNEEAPMTVTLERVRSRSREPAQVIASSSSRQQQEGEGGEAGRQQEDVTVRYRSGQEQVFRRPQLPSPYHSQQTQQRQLQQQQQEGAQQQQQQPARLPGSQSPMYVSGDYIISPIDGESFRVRPSPSRTIASGESSSADPSTSGTSRALVSSSSSDRPRLILAGPGSLKCKLFLENLLALTREAAPAALPEMTALVRSVLAGRAEVGILTTRARMLLGDADFQVPEYVAAGMPLLRRAVERGQMTVRNLDLQPQQVPPQEQPKK